MQHRIPGWLLLARDSFRSRLVLSNLLITLLGLLIVVVVFTQILAHQMRAAKERELRKQAYAVAGQIERLFAQNGGARELKPRVDAAALLLGERIIVVGPQGQARVDSAGKTPFDTGSWYKVDLRALKRGHSAQASLASQNLVLFQAPLQGTVRHGTVGAVLLVARVTDVLPPLSSIVGVALVLLGAASIVWLLIALFFTYSVFRPLNRITVAARRMALGQYDVEVPVQGQGEIARLAATFNTMARRVRETDRVQRDFVANVSHDLRTPLTMISGFSGALLDGTVGPDEVRTSAEIISLEAERMHRLVEDLLSLTKLEAGLLTLDRRTTAIRPLVQDVIDLLSRAWADRPHAPMTNRVPVDLPPAQLDPNRFERALRNLLENALQYTPPGGSIVIEGRWRSPGTVELAVRDTGRGIPADELARVWERFYRADRSRERAEGHSGLGLAIVREIVEAHGGSVSVESQVGRGSIFRLVVPGAAKAEAGAIREQRPQESVVG